MADVATANSFDVSKLRLQITHLSQLVLDDVLPLVGPAAEYQFKTVCNILFSPDQPDLLRVNVQVRASARSNGGSRGASKATAKVSVAVIFVYESLAELRQQEALPLGLGWTAVSIAYSTVRGLFQARLAGTSFAEALLPIVSPQVLWQPPTPAEIDNT